MIEGEVHPYYRERKPEIVAEFLTSLDVASPDFEDLMPGHSLTALTPRFLDELDQVLVTLPYVGGAEGRMTPFFERNAGVIALGRVLREMGVPIDAISTLMRKTYLSKLAGLPEAERLALGREWLSKESQAYLRQTALKSGERENPGDFVYHFVEAGLTPDGEPFEFGLNYSECGFCKLCKAGGDEDLLPSICAMDEEVYALRGIRLYRTTTLAGGDSQCNFRFGPMTDAPET